MWGVVVSGRRPAPVLGPSGTGTNRNAMSSASVSTRDANSFIASRHSAEATSTVRCSALAPRRPSSSLSSWSRPMIDSRPRPGPVMSHPLERAAGDEHAAFFWGGQPSRCRIRRAPRLIIRSCRPPEWTGVPAVCNGASKPVPSHAPGTPVPQPAMPASSPAPAGSGVPAGCAPAELSTLPVLRRGCPVRHRPALG